MTMPDPINDDIIIHQLHHLLASGQDTGAPLDISVDTADDDPHHFIISAGGDQPAVHVQLPFPQHTVHSMLTSAAGCQQRPVTINGKPVATAPHDRAPRVEFRNEYGHHNALAGSTRSGATITINGVSYTPADDLQAHQAPTSPPAVNGVDLLIDFRHEPQHGPHFQTVHAYRVSHHFIVDDATPEEIAASRFAFQRGQIICWPAASLLQRIEPQLAPSRVQAAALIGIAPDAADFTPMAHDRSIPTASYNLWSADHRIIPVADDPAVTPVLLDSTLPYSLEYSLARELIRNDHHGMVPVQPHRSGHNLPTVTVKGVQICTTDDRTFTLVIDSTPDNGWEHRPEPWHGINAKRITFNAVLTQPNSPRTRLVISSDFVALGHRYDELFWMTGDAGETVEALTERLYHAHWDSSQNEYRHDGDQADEYHRHCRVLAETILGGESRGFQVQLESHADSFISAAKPHQLPYLADSTPRHLMAWLPLPEDVDQEDRAALRDPAALAIGMLVRKYYGDLPAAQQETIYLAAVRDYHANDRLQQQLVNQVHLAAQRALS